MNNSMNCYNPKKIKCLLVDELSHKYKLLSLCMISESLSLSNGETNKTERTLKKFSLKQPMLTSSLTETAKVSCMPTLFLLSSVFKLQVIDILSVN